MPLPLGTYTINANGATGTLVIGSASGGTFNGTVFGQPLTGFFVEAEQRFNFMRVTSAELSTFEVYEGTLFSFSPTVSTLVQVLAGEFRAFPTPGAVTPFLWSAQLSQKLKEKEGKDGKDKEVDKDSKDFKDHHKENFKDKEFGKEKEHGGKELELAQGGGVSDMRSALDQLAARLSAVEQQIAVGRSFIAPSERPAVGPKTAGDEPKKG
jgi:hypothetical protein